MKYYININLRNEKYWIPLQEFVQKLSFDYDKNIFKNNL